MNRWRWVIRIALIVAIGIGLLWALPSLLDWLTGGTPPVVHHADVLVEDSLPRWKAQAARDSARADSLQALADADSAQRVQDAAYRRRMKRRADSLAAVNATLRSSLDSATSDSLPATATASDSAAYWHAIAYRQARLLGTLSSENLALREGDNAADREIAGLKDEATRLRAVNVILRSTVATTQAHVDELAAVVDTLRKVARTRCALLHPCLGATLGPGLAYRDGKIEANAVQVSVGLKLDLPLRVK